MAVLTVGLQQGWWREAAMKGSELLAVSMAAWLWPRPCPGLGDGFRLKAWRWKGEAWASDEREDGDEER
ncbi:hypothetical protein CCMA1212_006080 [Trichoderma ghanense]|uniref:Uncharacterized protein n=1 Tax=Trichoderma ghanense TaxID=65468 RepID=A0ABY2H4B9_9HYPO